MYKIGLSFRVFELKTRVNNNNNKNFGPFENLISAYQPG